MYYDTNGERRKEDSREWTHAPNSLAYDTGETRNTIFRMHIVAASMHSGHCNPGF